MLLRHVTAVAILPLTVVVLVPCWIARRYHVAPAGGSSAVEMASQLAGIVVIGIGLLLFGASLWNFAVRGRGTLAPWDPPKNLVIDGPYRYVRNPMISGVIFVLFGEALVLRSSPHAGWALVFLLVNIIYIPALEEPFLEQRFGDSYREYCGHVRRFIPRSRPWTP